ncbi:MAG TPA: flagellar protein FlbB [Xanthobacteraceae bacterium]
MIGVLIRLLRDLRLVPIVLTATIALFALKALGLALDGGYLFDNPSGNPDDLAITGTIAAPTPVRAPARPPPAAQKQSWAEDMFDYPDGPASAVSPPPPRPSAQLRVSAPPGLDITGAVGATPGPPKEEKPAAGGEAAPKKAPQEPAPAVNGTPVPLDIEHPVSPAERAILESLQKRRAELDTRAHELDVREDLLRAAEKRVGGRIEELKDLEARIATATQQRDEGEAARFKNVVTMYENMKAKDAAKIFDGLDIKVLLDVAREINPRRMSDILAQMTPEHAQRLTAELAARPVPKETASEADLPKIQGKPSAN